MRRETGAINRSAHALADPEWRIGVDLQNHFERPQIDARSRIIGGRGSTEYLGDALDEGGVDLSIVGFDHDPGGLANRDGGKKELLEVATGDARRVRCQLEQLGHRLDRDPFARSGAASNDHPVRRRTNAAHVDLESRLLEALQGGLRCRVGSRQLGGPNQRIRFALINQSLAKRAASGGASARPFTQRRGLAQSRGLGPSARLGKFGRGEADPQLHQARVDACQHLAATDAVAFFNRNFLDQPLALTRQADHTPFDIDPATCNRRNAPASGRLGCANLIRPLLGTGGGDQEQRHEQTEVPSGHHVNRHGKVG